MTKAQEREQRLLSMKIIKITAEGTAEIDDMATTDEVMAVVTVQMDDLRRTLCVERKSGIDELLRKLYESVAWVRNGWSDIDLFLEFMSPTRDRLKRELHDAARAHACRGC